MKRGIKVNGLPNAMFGKLMQGELLKGQVTSDFGGQTDQVQLNKRQAGPMHSAERCKEGSGFHVERQVHRTASFINGAEGC